MKVLDAGHVYQLQWLDGQPATSLDVDGALSEDVLTFVKRMGPGYPGNTSAHPGTNLQEVLRALIDRVKYLDAQISDDSNVAVLFHLRAAIWSLEDRAARRHHREALGHLLDIEKWPTCASCGHIGCVGSCKGLEK